MKQIDDLLNKLTIREKQVFNYLANGYLNKQIACELDIKENSVKTIVTKIFKKLAIKHKRELVSFVFTDFIKNIANNSFTDPVDAANQFLINLQVKPT